MENQYTYLVTYSLLINQQCMIFTNEWNTGNPNPTAKDVLNCIESLQLYESVALINF